MHKTTPRRALLLLACQLAVACSTTAPVTVDDDLDNTAWRLTALPGDPAVAGPAATLHFAGRKVSGSDGCNRFSGSYTATGNSLRVAGKLASTMMACPEGTMQQAAAFGSALQRATAFRRDGRRLLLQDDAGNVLATLREQATGLAGSAWQVTGYNNGRQAVVSLLAGSDLTLAFSADGRLSGSAGCNRYHATYSSSAQDIRIGPAGATRRTCGEPPGIMEQEARFLDALASAALWRLDGDRLELRTAGGALAVSLAAAAGNAAATSDATSEHSLLYRCGKQSVRLSAGADRLQLLPDGPGFALQPVVTASGTRYIAANDERTSFWSRGERATLVVGGRNYPECQRQR
jgi:heat shock protein HslJ